MKTLTYFFRHPHPIYFSIEKIFHAISGEMASQTGSDFFVREINLPFASKLATILNNILFVRKEQSRINHITGDTQYALLGCSSKNINILTVHDCVLLHRYPKTSPRFWIIRWLWYQLPVKKADAVTVISENTKKDLLHFTNCKPEKIRVIPNFIDPLFSARQKSTGRGITKLLFIGTAPNKNLERTIEAIQGLDVELLIVGYLSETQKAGLKEKNIRYSLQNKLTDAEMRDAYAEADIMLFPSVHEGFGLPIIEAQATGRPVLTSQLEPMISVSGGAACLVDPFNTESIRSGIQKIISDKPYRHELIERGFKNVERFQLKQVALQYRDLYAEIIREKIK
jgi:glycosyltransferase involved in cell wall biosynthesis